jgi:xanthine dehydrogenase YagS FAD-binding subunit
MEPFLYKRPQNAESAVRDAAGSRQGVPAVQAAQQFIAGGTNMTDYMKLNVMRPEVLVDINRLSATEYGKIEATDEGLRNAMTRRPRHSIGRRAILSLLRCGTGTG